MPEPPAPAIGRVRSTSPEPGVTAAELARRVRRHGSTSARELERWLIDSGLATNGDGLLRPTRRCLEVASTLNPLEGA